MRRHAYKALREAGCPVSYAAMGAFIYGTLEACRDDLLIGPYAVAAVGGAALAACCDAPRIVPIARDRAKCERCGSYWGLLIVKIQGVSDAS